MNTNVNPFSEQGNHKKMVKVFITVDTEIWPKNDSLADPDQFQKDCYRWIFGRTNAGDFGLPRLLEILEQYNLKALFFVESLFASFMGQKWLREIIDRIQQAGQEVQLHLHPEWLKYSQKTSLPPNRFPFMSEYSREEQQKMCEMALSNMRACGVEKVLAFRAGNFGADRNTLQIIKSLGLKVDSSYNRSFLGQGCDIDAPQPIRQPTRCEGIIELPISNFQDWPGHFRHAAICACSYSELSGMLLQAWKHGWTSFVLLAHSVELLNMYNTGPDSIVIGRFEKLCRFLAEHREQFETCHLNDLEIDQLVYDGNPPKLVSNVIRTAYRYGEQLGRRILSMGSAAR